MSRIPGSIDSAVEPSEPIERTRLVDRLSAASACPITLLIAPAGYGKSVALRQYLGTLDRRSVCFSLRSEHATLLGFVRGFAEAFGEKAPHAIASLAEAYERNISSPNRGADLAQWMRAHLDSFAGVVGIDDLHVAEADPEVAQFLTSLIELTKGTVRWILASRSTTGLPVGTWLAYRDADPVIDECDLAFTSSEAREAANRLGLVLRDDELADILRLTEGWPAATSFALRTSMHSADLRNVTATTREMSYRLLAEQVYKMLDEDERALLEVAIALPSIDIRVLQAAGFDRALTIIERMRERTAFIYEESPGIYRCHDLFRDFLHHQSALNGKRSLQIANDRAARALEASGDVEHAIASYVAAESSADVLRLLERHGFDLLERARGDVVTRAVEALDEKTRRENASVLALQGALQATLGKFSRAESLFRRALAQAGDDRDLKALTSLRLASVIGNQGRSVSSVLDPISSDGGQSASYRAEALSLAAARQLMSGGSVAVGTVASTIESLLPQVDSEITRARILHHLGIINRHAGNIEEAFGWLVQASELATDLHFYGIASRTFAVLSNLALHERDNVEQQFHYAELAAEAATKAGDAFAIEIALLQMLSAQMRKKDVKGSIAIERRLTALQIDPLAHHYVTLFKALRLAWEERFGEAHRLLSGCWLKMPFPVDRASSGCQYALFLALDGRRDASTEQIRRMLAFIPTVKSLGLFDVRALAISRAFCALAELANGRSASAERILRGARSDDSIARLAVSVAKLIVGAWGADGANESPQVAQEVARLTTLGYGDVAGLLAAASRQIVGRKAPRANVVLTTSERKVLRQLAGGLAPKEIAEETERSVHTVRVHIANAISKLECHGRSEAIRAARRRGLI
jgi:DNA-binding CsgD family transcriptional regulator/tetratricopeptide (TPR) repeat protein